MFLHEFLLYISYLIFVAESEVNSNKSDDFEEFYTFPKMLLQQLNESKTYQDDHEIIDYNVRKETPSAEKSQYIKGFSLRIPKPKFVQYGNSPNVSQIEKEIRTKRGVAHLYNMISCATGCNPISYKGYGCFCGLLGSGYPVDGIDRCCKMHDWCYDAAKCPMYLEYFVPYYWKCWYNRPFCAVNHGEFGPPGSCADKLCECDRALSGCLRRFPCPTRRAFCRSSPFRFLQNAFMFFT